MIRFDRNCARDLEATFELRVRVMRRWRPLVLTLSVDHGKWRVRPGAPAEANAAATISLGDMLKLALGTKGWPALLSSGRLELAGDPFLALRLPMLFRLPVGSRARPGHSPAGSR